MPAEKARDILRDRWAGIALRVLLLRVETISTADVDALAAQCYRMADAMEKARCGPPFILITDPAATYESVRRELEGVVGECCRGGDPMCSRGCLVEAALHRRGIDPARPQNAGQERPHAG